MSTSTLDELDGHINTTWLKLANARRIGAALSIIDRYERTLDAYLDQRLTQTKAAP